MTDRFFYPRLAQNTDTKQEYVSNFTVLWRLIEAVESEGDADGWKTEGEHFYVYIKGNGAYCLMGSMEQFIAEWDIWRKANTYLLN